MTMKLDPDKSYIFKYSNHKSHSNFYGAVYFRTQRDAGRQSSSKIHYLSLCLDLLNLQTSKLPFALFLFPLKNASPLG